MIDMIIWTDVSLMRDDLPHSCVMISRREAALSALEEDMGAEKVMYEGYPETRGCIWGVGAAVGCMRAVV